MLKKDPCEAAHLLKLFYLVLARAGAGVLGTLREGARHYLLFECLEHGPKHHLQLIERQRRACCALQRTERGGNGGGRHGSPMLRMSCPPHPTPFYSWYFSFPFSWEGRALLRICLLCGVSERFDQKGAFQSVNHELDQRLVDRVETSSVD